MIKHFMFIWVGYWSAVFLLPVNPVYPAVLSAFLLQLLFVFLVIAGYSWFWVASNAARCPPWGQYAPRNLRFMILTALWLSIIGTLCLLVDKIVIQGIDYSQGIAVAREAWRKEGVEREGSISSIFSVLGYLLSSGYFVAAALIVLGGKSLGSSTRYRVISLVFILLMLNSALAGGRSNVLLLAVFIVGSVTSVRGWSYKELFYNKFCGLWFFCS
jgi:hypothetical protein